MTRERIVEFTPAFDKRSSDPSKDYGIHGVDMRMVLKGVTAAAICSIKKRRSWSHV